MCFSVYQLTNKEIFECYIVLTTTIVIYLLLLVLFILFAHIRYVWFYCSTHSKIQKYSKHTVNYLFSTMKFYHYRRALVFHHSFAFLLIDFCWCWKRWKVAEVCIFNYFLKYLSLLHSSTLYFNIKHTHGKVRKINTHSSKHISFERKKPLQTIHSLAHIRLIHISAMSIYFYTLFLLFTCRLAHTIRFVFCVSLLPLLSFIFFAIHSHFESNIVWCCMLNKKNVNNLSYVFVFQTKLYPNCYKQHRRCRRRRRRRLRRM